MRITRKMTAALQVARDAQTAYWEALLTLEKAIGVEVDGKQDLLDATIEHLMEKEGLVLRPGSRTRGGGRREQVQLQGPT
jgi:hypothetical protein